MALAPPPSRYDVPDGWLIKRLARGDPGILDRIRARYGLAVYAIAYGELMDPRSSAAVVDETMAECARTARIHDRGQGSLYEHLAATARRLSGAYGSVGIQDGDVLPVPVTTHVVRERWTPPAQPIGSWSIVI